MSRESLQLTAREMARAVRSGRVPWNHFVAKSLAGIQRVEGGAEPLGAFLSTLHSAPAAPPDPIHSGGPLAGVPVAVKDNLVTLDLPTTCGSRMLEGFRSPFEATAVRRLREAGAVVVGKTNMDEFGMGSSTEYSAFGPTRNPHDRSRVPGGSSGGSAAAVAAGLVPAALGSDTGGSVRQPASLCGVVGIKPTYGRVSRYGLVAFASSLDQVGTLGRTVEDAAALLEVISGHDPRDATCRAEGPLVLPAGDESASLDDLVIGVPDEFMQESLDEPVRTLCHQALGTLEEMGARLETISLPSSRYAIPTYYVLAPAEASSNLARFDGIRYGQRWGDISGTSDLYLGTRSRGFGIEVRRRILLGTFVLSAGYYEAYYLRAQNVRRHIGADYARTFDSGVHTIFTPTSPTTAFAFGERLDDPMKMYLSDVFTVTANLAGLPALSLPIGAVDRLPVGGQLLGPAWSEPLLVRVAKALEASLRGQNA